MYQFSIEELRKVRLETSDLIQIIDVINGRVFDFESIFPDENTAKQAITRDVLDLVHKTYDFFPATLNFDMGLIVCAFYHKKRRDIIGTVALHQYFQQEIIYFEIGLSLIAPKYRKLGFQSVEARRIREYAYFFLRQGHPFYISARMASAATQLQVNKGRLPNVNGTVVNVAYPKGFLPTYIANKNEAGQFILEFGMFFEAWPELDRVIQKDIHIPVIAKDRGYYLFNPSMRSDVRPIFHKIEFIADNVILCDNTHYEWNHLKHHASIFGNLKSDKTLQNSIHRKFNYSEISAPNEADRAIAIESVNSLDFLSDISNENMKSINITLQISDFSSEESQIANLAIIQQVLEANFIPCCIYDLKQRESRIRVAMFSKWGQIPLQDYFEFLPEYHSVFKIFWHDCMVHKIIWNPRIIIMTPDKIEGMILIERFKSIF